jgi:phosphatidate cytidylyltransferase
MGAVLVALSAGVLVIDQRLGPWYPFLFLLLVALGGMACFELRRLLAATHRPAVWVCYASVGGLIVANWPAHLGGLVAGLDRDPWHWIAATMAAVVMAAFLAEMAVFHEPGSAVMRAALTVWIAGYLGLLPCFFAQLRWIGSPTDSAEYVGIDRGTLALALAIFVPKCSDIGAYFTGRMLGRHLMAPILSPKKTWEGAVGGLAAAIAAAVIIDQWGPVVPYQPWGALAFGITVGGAGMLGDLAESLIKRDCSHKDASQAVPGFGGVLDVVDSIIFAGPVAYWWLR